MLGRAEASSNASVRFGIRVATGTGLGCVYACNVVRALGTRMVGQINQQDSENEGTKMVQHALQTVFDVSMVGKES